MPATMQEVEKLIKRSPAKSCGLDTVPTWLLKQHAECLVPTITSIVNMSLTDDVFPDQFKTAHVCPLIKKSALYCNALKNYRPVSNIPYISKSVEKVVGARLQKHLQDNQLYEPMQSAYRPVHNTETALVRVTMQCSLVCSRQASGSDPRPSGLVCGIRYCGPCHPAQAPTRGDRCLWSAAAVVESYMTGRKQAITINKTSSSECDLIYGVGAYLKGLCLVRSCSCVTPSRLEPLRASVGCHYTCMQMTRSYRPTLRSSLCVGVS